VLVKNRFRTFGKRNAINKREFRDAFRCRNTRGSVRFGSRTAAGQQRTFLGLISAPSIRSQGTRDSRPGNEIPPNGAPVTTTTFTRGRYFFLNEPARVGYASYSLDSVTVSDCVHGDILRRTIMTNTIRRADRTFSSTTRSRNGFLRHIPPTGRRDEENGREKKHTARRYGCTFRLVRIRRRYRRVRLVRAAYYVIRDLWRPCPLFIASVVNINENRMNDDGRAWRWQPEELAARRPVSLEVARSPREYFDGYDGRVRLVTCRWRAKLERDEYKRITFEGRVHTHKIAGCFPFRIRFRCTRSTGTNQIGEFPPAFSTPVPIKPAETFPESVNSDERRLPAVHLFSSAERLRNGSYPKIMCAVIAASSNP